VNSPFCKDRLNNNVLFTFNVAERHLAAKSVSSVVAFASDKSPTAWLSGEFTATVNARLTVCVFSAPIADVFF
jgi:hypothetical protein